MDKCYSCKYLTKGSDEVYCNISFTMKCENYELYEPKETTGRLQKLDRIRNYLITNVMRNPDIMFNDQIRECQKVDLVDIIASLYEELHKEVTGESYEYMFHWANKVGADCKDDLFKNMKEGD